MDAEGNSQNDDFSQNVKVYDKKSNTTDSLEDVFTEILLSESVERYIDRLKPIILLDYERGKCESKLPIRSLKSRQVATRIKDRLTKFGCKCYIRGIYKPVIYVRWKKNDEEFIKKLLEVDEIEKLSNEQLEMLYARIIESLLGVAKFAARRVSVPYLDIADISSDPTAKFDKLFYIRKQIIDRFLQDGITVEVPTIADGHITVVWQVE